MGRLRKWWLMRGFLLVILVAAAGSGCCSTTTCSYPAAERVPLREAALPSCETACRDNYPPGYRRPGYPAYRPIGSASSIPY